MLAGWLAGANGEVGFCKCAFAAKTTIFTILCLIFGCDIYSENSQVSSKLVSYMAFWNALVQLVRPCIVQPSLQGFISSPPYANRVGCVGPTVDLGSGYNVHYSMPFSFLTLFVPYTRFHNMCHIFCGFKFC